MASLLNLRGMVQQVNQMTANTRNFEHHKVKSTPYMLY